MTDHDIQTEERLLYCIIAVVSAPVLFGVTLARSPFDGGSTLTLLLFTLALVGFVASLRRRARGLPHAQVRPDDRS